MANYKTGAQRYNDRMDKIWEQARRTEPEYTKPIPIDIHRVLIQMILNGEPSQVKRAEAIIADETRTLLAEFIIEINKPLPQIPTY